MTETLDAEPLFHLVAGPTGAGKTTFALALTERLGGVRFSIDEWMTTLFWPDAPAALDYAWAIERVNRCEAMIAEAALAVTTRAVPRRQQHLGYKRHCRAGAGARALRGQRKLRNQRGRLHRNSRMAFGMKPAVAPEENSVLRPQRSLP